MPWASFCCDLNLITGPTAAGEVGRILSVDVASAVFEQGGSASPQWGAGWERVGGASPSAGLEGSGESEESVQMFPSHVSQLHSFLTGALTLA